MKRYFIFVFILGLVWALTGCKRGIPALDKPRQDSSRIDTTTFVASYTHDQFLDDITKDYVDTLNQWIEGTELPKFLFDNNLDRDSKINDVYNSHFVSLRIEIFKRVTSKGVLEKIIATDFFKNQFDGIESQRERVVSDKISTSFLAQKRLTELSFSL